MSAGRVVGIVLAGGRGERALLDGDDGRLPKQFRRFRGRPLAFHALELFERSQNIDEIVFVGPAKVDPWPALPFSKVTARIEGGLSRAESVRGALKALPKNATMVVVHDAVRPNASEALLARVVAAAREVGAAVPAVASRDTVKRVRGDRVVETIARETVRLAQTPQAFRREILEEAYRVAARHGDDDVDDATIVERMGAVVAVVDGETRNIKITFAEDFEWLA